MWTLRQFQLIRPVMEHGLLYSTACLHLKLLTSNLELFQVEEAHMDTSCQNWYTSSTHVAKCPWSSFALFNSEPEPPQGPMLHPQHCVPDFFQHCNRHLLPNHCQQLWPPLPSTPLYSCCPWGNINYCGQALIKVPTPSGSPSLPFHLSNTCSTSLSVTQVQLDSASVMPDDQQKALWVRKAEYKLRSLQ